MFKRSHLYTVVQKFCEDASFPNGLLLLDMPTGFGKTHTMLDYIFTAACSAAFKNRKIFFITTLKKNLPQKELEERFKKVEKTELFHEKFLFVDSFADSVISNLTTDVAKSIPDGIKQTEEYKALRQEVEFLQKQKKRQDRDLNGFVPSIRENLRTRSEPAFRNSIRKNLEKEFRTVESRLYAIKTDPKWQWIGKLYPIVFSRERQIIFMSVDKFISQYSTIVEPSCMLYNSPILKDAVIFIDEVDATKETILKNIIQNDLQDDMDCLKLFREIYAALRTNSFPKKLTTPSKQRMEGRYKDQSLQGVIDGIKEKAEEIHNQFSLQFPHKTVKELENGSQNFLFQDHRFHSILDASKSCVVTTSDPDQRINKIQFAAERPAAEKNNIQVLLGKLRGFISFFQGAVNILATNYQQCKQEQRKEGENEFSRESAVYTVLEEFSLSDFHKEYLASQILRASRKNKGAIEGAEYDLSLYENGFRYYAFVDDTAYDMRSCIKMYGFQNTPEKMLLRFCEKAKVVGISATATVPSIIGNFDLGYLKRKMQNAYVQLTEEDKKFLRAEFNENTAGYKKIEIHTKLISGKEQGIYSKESWKQIFDRAEVVEAAFSFIEQKLALENNSYNKERYLRIAAAYKEFWTHSDIQSFLCVLTKHPRPRDPSLDLNVLYYLFDLIHQSLEISGRSEDFVVQLDGEEYDAKKNYILERLENGEKLFVISVYQTIGAGQNLQYKIPKQDVDKLISSNFFPSRGEKDFDAIYLDKPTNILVQLKNQMDEESFVKYLFQIEFLQEAAELSQTDSVALIRNAFAVFSGSASKYKQTGNMYKCQSTVLLSTKMLIQAIGRICRTNQKKSNIYIFADEGIANCIDHSVSDDERLLNPEFVALLDKLKGSSQLEVMTTAENAAALLSVRVNKHIRHLLSEKWTAESISQWQELRQLVLKYPTMNSENANFIAENFYVKLPALGNRLWYCQQKDFGEISVGFAKSDAMPFEVSEEEARLGQLMSVASIREFFERQGFATEFRPNRFIMSPALFNNIYKGALGEVVGRYIFETKILFRLEEINEPKIFELFDFKLHGKSVFVDFKLWKESTQFDPQAMRQKIVGKAKECQAKCVIIANVLADGNYDLCDSDVEGVRIVEIPSLLHFENDGGCKLVRKAFEKLRGIANEFSD